MKPWTKIDRAHCVAAIAVFKSFHSTKPVRNLIGYETALTEVGQALSEALSLCPECHGRSCVDCEGAHALIEKYGLPPVEPGGDL